MSKIRKTDNFVLQITPPIWHLQKNRSIPRHSQHKILQERNKKKFRGCILGSIICLTKSTFLVFFEKSQNRQFCLENCSMKIILPEKRKYTMTQPTKNATKLSFQIINFHIFVTEYIHLKFAIFNIFQFLKFEKTMNFK